MLAMDLFSCRIVGFGVEAAQIDGVAVCRMYSRIIARQLLAKLRPKYSGTVLFWIRLDTLRKLGQFASSHNGGRVHSAHAGSTSSEHAASCATSRQSAAVLLAETRSRPTPTTDSFVVGSSPRKRNRRQIRGHN